MALRTFNATRAETGGPFESVEKAAAWAFDHLAMNPLSDRDGIVATVKEDIAEDGRAMISEESGRCFEEDVVIFDDERHEPDEEGYIEW